MHSFSLVHESKKLILVVLVLFETEENLNATQAVSVDLNNLHLQPQCVFLKNVK